MTPDSDLARATDIAWAAGMVGSRQGSTLEDAMVWMRLQASETGQSIDDIALAVIERRLLVTE